MLAYIDWRNIAGCTAPLGMSRRLSMKPPTLLPCDPGHSRRHLIRPPTTSGAVHGCGSVAKASSPAEASSSCCVGAASSSASPIPRRISSDTPSLIAGARTVARASTGCSSLAESPRHTERYGAAAADERARPGAPRLPGALMDIAPALARLIQRDGDGMVGLLIVRLGVLVGGVVGAGHPAAGQAHPQSHPAASVIKALQTPGRVWADRAGAGEMLARRGAVEVAPRLGCSWHRFPSTAVLSGYGYPPVNLPRADRETGRLSSAHQVA
jgi:hypothetical protein